MTKPTNQLRSKMSRGAVRYAVQRAIFCPTCGSILDTRSAILATSPTRAGVSCLQCFTALIKAYASRYTCTPYQALETIESNATLDYGSVALRNKLIETIGGVS